MKHTFIQNEQAEGSAVTAILSLIGAVVVAVVYFAIIPMIGSKIDSTASVPAGSAWNSTENPTLPTGASLWDDVGGMITIAFTIIAVGIVIFVLRGVL